jgi:adenosylhomocysteine nucleosidase
MSDTAQLSKTPQPVALVAAMESELRHALERISARTAEKIGPYTVHRGSLHGRKVVAMASGIGMVNAAAATAVLLASERPEFVLNFGCAGAHRNDIHPGDVVIGEGVVAHLSLTILPTGEERYAGFRFQVDDDTILTDVIPADRVLFDLAASIGRDWTPDSWPWARSDSPTVKVHTGIIASADCWTQDPIRIGGLHDLHGSLCEDMEAAAVAQVCAIFKTPMLAIKDISNNELHMASDPGDEGLPSLETVEREVGARAFALVDQIVERL